MILLTGYLHRDDLKDIIFRWMSNELLEEDCERIKEIVNFNVYIVNLYLDSFSNDFFSAFYGGNIWNFDANTKGELKDVILQAAPYHDQRLEQIKTAYTKYPEDFYRSTPFLGKIYCSGSREHPIYLGHSRIKRFRRVAEKASRRMIDIIFAEIRKAADELASERAHRLGIPKEYLVTPVEEQKEEFAHAERRFLKWLKTRTYHPDEGTIKGAAIHDVAGVKAIIDHERKDALEAYFNETRCCSIVEKEGHSGQYDAVNYIIRVKVDKERLINQPPDSRVINVLAARGMNRDAIVDDYKMFVNTAEDHVYLEIITSHYPEMIESEFGRSMHEERILSQRNQMGYKSSVARNVRYITEYLFLFAVSGKARIHQLPVKLWEKAMPDTYDHAIRELWDIPTMPVL
jgi:hypothetical protein